MKTTLLIDGDIIAYQHAFGTERVTDWGDGVWSWWADENDAARLMDEWIAAMKHKFSADRVIIALSDADNFRKRILPTYKGNRAEARKPILLKRMREHLTANHTTYCRPGLEGDDVLGIIMTSEKIAPGKRICVSIDKDMRTIPGRHYDAKHDKKLMVSELEADRFHMIQTLSGDPTDGYSGCPGIGKVKAHRLLHDKEPREWWPTIVAAYEKAGLTEADALVQARVARILRVTDYDFAKKEPILWTPPSYQA
jgi:DNA polymerase-1